MEDKKRTILLRMYIVYFIVAAFGTAVIGKIIHIQVVEGPMWREKAEKVLLRYEQVDPIRGNIYSSDGNLLAVSVPIFEIRMDVANTHVKEEYFRTQVDSLAQKLSQLFRDRTAREYRQELLQARKSKNRFLLIKRNVTYGQLKVLKTFPIFNLGKYGGGLIVIEKTRRELPYKNMVYRTIGWDKEGSVNDVGLEGSYSELLSGKPGKQLMQKIGNGMWRPLNDEFIVPPQHGYDIVTTIDVVLQDVATEALRAQLTEHNADHGCAVLMEVHTGYIKAIANLKKTSSGSYVEEYNYAIAESSEPGSTFKLASVLAALEDKLADANQIIQTGNGEFTYANQKMRDTHKGGYGAITLKKAFEVSSNVGISKMIYDAYRNQPEKYINRLHSMSIGTPLGIEIEGEGKPFVKSPSSKSWSKVSLPWMSIGYELKITPLQTLAIYNAVANDGVMVKPLLVKEISSMGQPVKAVEPVVINASIASKSTIAQVRQMLEGVVENGTAKNLFNSMYRIAGKTGTAQIASGKTGYNKTNYKASFVGYFPADDPKYSCIVVINNPSKGAYYGGAIAAPVFKQIADRVYANDIRIQPEHDTSLVQPFPFIVAGVRSDIDQITNRLHYNTSGTCIQEWITASVLTNKLSTKDKNIDTHTLPDVCGMSARDAIYLLEKLGVSVTLEGKGLVVSQSPPAGAGLDSTNHVALLLALKPMSDEKPQ